ncbi:hypothetical protein [Diaphorobacter nitroreducens]|uniref:hypothetical protein n=1 Tax=Diaphorobacter nitroreducens TaxID=164759 RepID=UPI002897914F|nr:hypothetical protein [Diaphorobacter nitroreducens]
MTDTQKIKQAAPAAVAGPPSINLRELGSELRKVLYCLGGPEIWALYRDGAQVRYLDKFENDFVDSSLAAAPTTQAARDVLAERQRQISDEGWTPEHDDTHGPFALGTAAGCYAMYTLAFPEGDPPPGWPWATEWWKPRDHRRNLVKAGALILAELERFDRYQAHEGGAA